MSGAIPPLLNAPWCSLKAQGQLYLFTSLSVDDQTNEKSDKSLG